VSAGTEVTDAVVIGAGHNGLVAANLLADAGWDVLVLEATGQPGGAVRSAEVTAPGYLSDLFSAFYPLAAASPVISALRLGRYGLAWRHAPDVLGHLLPDGRAVVMSRDAERTAASVEAFADGDGRRWLAAYAEWLRVSPGLVEGLFTPFPPVRSGVSLVRQVRLSGALRLARRFLLPVWVLGDELFRGEGARLLLAGCAQHTDLAPVDAGSGVYGWLMAMLGQQYGFPVPAGGAGRLTDALVARLYARGGRVVCGARVARIRVRHGRAVGVDTVDGRRVAARRAVLADVPAPVLYRDLVGPDHLPARLMEDLEHFRWDVATVKVDWALAGPVPWRNEAMRNAGTLHLAADMNGLVRYSSALTTGEIPPDPFMVAGQLTTTDPIRSPPGTESLWAYTHLPWRPDWAADEVAAAVDRMEAVFEEHAPGFRGLVRGRRVAGPKELEAENPSLVGGAVGAGTSAIFQQLFLRPVAGLGRPDTPIDRLYLSSASAYPGGGVHGGPGANAAHAALARARRLTGRLYAAAIAAAQHKLYSDGRRTAANEGERLDR